MISETKLLALKLCLFSICSNLRLVTDLIKEIECTGQGSSGVRQFVTQNLEDKTFFIYCVNFLNVCGILLTCCVNELL